MKTKNKMIACAIIVASTIACTDSIKKVEQKRERRVNLLVVGEQQNYEVVETIPADTIPYQKGQELVIAQPSKNVPEYWEIPKSDIDYIQYQQVKIDSIQSIYYE